MLLEEDKKLSILTERKHDTELNNTLQSISFLQELPENWNNEEAETISSETIGRSKDLLYFIACEASNNEIPLRLPRISPSIDGGVQFFWNNGTQSTLLEVLPENPGIFCQSSDFGEEIRIISKQEAARAALTAMSNFA